MTKEDILRKAMKRAISNGWKPSHYQLNVLGEFNLGGILEAANYNIIFDHDFAKALFGTKPMCSACERWHDAFCDCDYGIGNDMEEWQIRIRQMVLEPEPLKYIEQFLNKT